MEIKIDYNKTTPEYYKKKAEEIIKRFPKRWPDNPKEAFELFKFRSKYWLIQDIISFLNEVPYWNENAMREVLKEINQFIDESDEIPIDKVFRIYEKWDLEDPNIIREQQKMYYQKVINGFYNRSHIRYAKILGDYTVEHLYGKYDLFKDLLVNKLNKLEKQNEKQDQKNKILQIPSEKQPLASKEDLEPANIDDLVKKVSFQYREKFKDIIEKLPEGKVNPYNCKKNVLATVAVIFFCMTELNSRHEWNKWINDLSYTKWLKMFSEAYHRKGVPTTKKSQAIKMIYDIIKKEPQINILPAYFMKTVPIPNPN